MLLFAHYALVKSLKDAIRFDEKDVLINKELLRVNKNALEQIKKTKQVLKRFPQKKDTAKSILVLKKTKTKKSKRRNKLTDPLMEDLLELREIQIHNQIIHGPNYNNNNLVFSLPNGDPIEPSRLQKWFK